MRYENGKALELRLAYVGGGSRGWAWSFMTDLAIEPALGGEVALYDIDREAAEANRIIGGRVDARPSPCFDTPPGRPHWGRGPRAFWAYAKAKLPPQTRRELRFQQTA